MTSIMDRGDSYRVEYLGSSMLMAAATGLGVLQKPLRDLYFQYQQSGSRQGTLQERHLTMTSSGVNMVFKDSRSSPTQEVFYPMPSILFWDAVQFVTVRGQDKKVRGAFEPLDNDHSRNKDNLFVVLEKKYHFLQQRAHPSIFTCVLRRTAGLKALDVHAFICSSEDEAVGLMRALNAVQQSFTSDQVSETGVFGYNPFGKESVRSTAGLERLQAAQQRLRPAQPPNPASGHAQQIDVGPGMQRFPLPGVAPVSRNESVRSTTSHVSNSSRVYQLTQSDLVQAPPSRSSPTPPTPQALAPSHSNERVVARKAITGLSPVKETSGDSNEHAYQYIRQVDKSLERPSGAAAGRNVTGPSSGQQQQQQPAVSPTAFIHDSSVGSPPGQPARPSSLEYGARRYTGGEKLEPRGGSLGSRGSGSNTGQGYGLLSGSGGPIPGQHPPRHFYDDSSPEPSPDPGRLRQPARPPSPSYETSLPRNQQAERNSHFAVQRSPKLPPRLSPGPRLRGLPRRDLPPTPDDSADSSAVQSPAESPYTCIQGKDKAGSRFAPENPNRPVAKVPPQPPSFHKRTGVKVLPTAPVAPLRPSSDISGHTRPKSTYFSDSSPSPDQDYGLPPSRSQSQYFGEKHFQSEPISAPQRSKSNKYESNWQFKSSGSSLNIDYQTMTPEEIEEYKNRNRSVATGEKLLQSQKKDAEIASAMENLRFDYERTMPTNTLSPQRTNFEKSLGYFP